MRLFVGNTLKEVSYKSMRKVYTIIFHEKQLKKLTKNPIIILARESTLIQWIDEIE